jgi:HSP20 family protein
MANRGSSNGFPIQQLRDEMDRLVNNVFSNPTVAGATRFLTGRGFPAFNVWENTENVFAETEVPGVRPEDLIVTVVGNELTVKGSRSDDAAGEAVFHRRERGVGAFTRVVSLPSEINSDNVTASLTDGVLLLTLQKAEAAKPRKIKVSADTKSNL